MKNLGGGGGNVMHNIFSMEKVNYYNSIGEHIGSVVEILAQDRVVVDSSLTGDVVLCP